MGVFYLGAAVGAVGLALLLQRRVAMPPRYAWLSRIASLVFAVLALPAVVREPSDRAIGQLVLLAMLPLIAIPYQVRLIERFERSRNRAPSAGPGGGHARPRGGARKRR